MTTLNRRTFIATTFAAATVRTLPAITTKPAARRILTLVYDKTTGMMRAIDRVVH